MISFFDITGGPYNSDDEMLAVAVKRAKVEFPEIPSKVVRDAFQTYLDENSSDWSFFE